VSTALYRRYRPESFAEVIGQEHVTEPLMQALRSNRVNHAHLFSGPRGCGKTTSARILARILNCAKNTPETPTDTPCGECESCVELARGGPGSLDVVEIDAASHGGVDDARELRERATFSPSRDRFKIFILDEAHMVTAQGFNALLKIVEEPPDYLKFIFATTEPEKVIGTIRSRTHHYPFRLVAPDTLQAYLAQVSAQEDIAVGAGVLPLVVRAGGGSVRDSLSVLDQLMAGAEGGALDYERAVALLGFTHVTLLDDVVEALAARDGASMFRVVDHVVATGHEPRRFVEDILERLRDLIVLSVSGESAQAVLRSVPEDQLARMQAQSAHLGAAELSRSADVVNAALTEMSGATSPRLHLELLCARLLLPAVDDSATGLAARIDRLERGGAGRPAASYAEPTAAAASVGSPVSTPVAAPAASAQPAVPQTPTVVDSVDVRSGDEETAPAASAASSTPPWEDLPGTKTETAELSVAAQRAPATAPQQSAPAPAADTARADSQAATSAEMLRRRWPEVLDTLSRLRKSTWALVSQNAQVAELTDATLRLTFASAGLATAFRNSPGAELVQRAVRETLGFEIRVEGSIEEPGRAPTAVQPSTGHPVVSARPVGSVPGIDPAAAAASWDEPVATVTAPPAPPSVLRSPQQQPPAQDVSATGNVAGESTDSVGAAASVTVSTVPSGVTTGDAASEGRASTSGNGGPVAAEFGEEPPDDLHHEPEPEPEPVLRNAAAQVVRGSVPAVGAHVGEAPRRAAERRAAVSREQDFARAQEIDDPRPDDEDLASSNLVGVPLVAQILGGVVIDEITDNPA
jgi:DNA polymerase III subunit gamma/tau